MLYGGLLRDHISLGCGCDAVHPRSSRRNDPTLPQYPADDTFSSARLRFRPARSYPGASFLFMVFSKLSHRNFRIQKGIRVDPDYRGEAGIVIQNPDNHEFVLWHNMRIAQIIYFEAVIPRERIVRSHKALSRTKRGAKGFGSTGLR